MILQLVFFFFFFLFYLGDFFETIDKFGEEMGNLGFFLRPQ